MKLGTEGETFEVADSIRLTETQILTLTLWGETRGEPVEGKVAVGCVIRNRVETGRWGDSYAKVCLAAYQFSCWRKEGGASNHKDVMAMADILSSGREVHDLALRECGYIAHGIIAGWLQDRTRGATHYYAPEAMVPMGKIPAWAINLSPCATVGDHLFFKGVK
jgi:N-acetylmuramoyl-L-alanine amidase